MVYATRWNDTVEDMDRQRRKQAEFLVHQRCPWPAIGSIAVLNPTVQAQVEAIMARHAPALRRSVAIHPEWYY